MPVIELVTLIQAPVARVFDLARSVEAHQIGRYSAGTGTFCNDRRELRVTSSLGFRLDRLRYLFALSCTVGACPQGVAAVGF